jgi:hypothetical protein
MTALWPERIQLEYLERVRVAVGGPIFNAMYLGEPDQESGDRTETIPDRRSFEQFLLADCMAPASGGDENRGLFAPYSFNGREALLHIVRQIDKIITDRIEDATVSLAGGAQIGKSMLQHGLVAYGTGQRFLNVMLFLPDKDLVAGVVQTKFRPNVVDQIPWFARMMTLGIESNESGKAVNRIGAFSVTDGIKRAGAMFCGLNKVPTTFSCDVAIVDEVDDVDSGNESFIGGRLTNSNLRLIFKAGTQRVHGRGMQKAWKDGSQGVFTVECPSCGKSHNPEESFPEIVCIDTDDGEVARLTYNADLRVGDRIVCEHAAENSYRLGCTSCGAELDTATGTYVHRRPAKLEFHEYSFRISQLCMSAISLSKIVNDWRKAIESESKMVTFRTDVLGLPRSSAQKLEPAIMDRARHVIEFSPGYSHDTKFQRFAGLDIGSRCWFVVREMVGPHDKRIIWAESIPLHVISSRVPTLVQSLGVTSTFIDQMPETKESRQLAYQLNGFGSLDRLPAIPDSGRCYVSVGNGVAFSRGDDGAEKWVGLRAAVVRFDHKKLGAGIDQRIDRFVGSDGMPTYVPLIACNRFETVDAVVREFLTPAEGEIDVIHGLGIRQSPAIRLPNLKDGIWQEFEDHHIAGSERGLTSDNELGDYVRDENHLLFANGYARLSEVVCKGNRTRVFSASRIGTSGTGNSGV